MTTDADSYIQERISARAEDHKMSATDLAGEALEILG
jgi:hypothetical protein